MQYCFLKSKLANTVYFKLRQYSPTASHVEVYPGK